MARTSLEHSKIVLSAILPDRVDLLSRAMTQLTDTHFPDAQYKNIFLLLERYLDTTGGVLTRSALLDTLGRNKVDAGKIALYAETYDALVSSKVEDTEFRWSVDSLKNWQPKSRLLKLLLQAWKFLIVELKVLRVKTLSATMTLVRMY